MNIRVFNPKSTDWEAMSRWWVAKNLPPVPLECLPETGLCVHDNGVLLAGGFVQFSETKVAGIGNIVANPLATQEMRSEALNILLEELMTWAKDKGHEIVHVATNVPALQKRYEDLGFEKTDTNVTHYIRRI